MDDLNRNKNNLEKTAETIISSENSAINEQFNHLEFPTNISLPILNQYNKNLFMNQYSAASMHMTDHPQSSFSTSQMPFYQQNFQYVQQQNQLHNNILYPDAQINSYLCQNVNNSHHGVEDLYNSTLQSNNFQHVNTEPHVDQNPKINSNSSQFIDNLVGNWMPNTPGTYYSPFGNVHLSNNVRNILGDQMQQNSRNVQEPVEETNGKFENGYFPFSRDTRKPRVVAEVKPMRPSYSAVLTKSAPQVITKPKTEVKDLKNKKDNFKRAPKDKSYKNVVFNHTSKENKPDKSSANNKVKEKQNKENKPNQLNRKWSSLDNVTTTSDDFKVVSESFNNNDSNDNKDNLKKDISDVYPQKNNNSKNNAKKANKTADNEEYEVSNGKNESNNSVKSSLKRKQVTSKSKNSDTFGSTEKPNKRSQRMRKRENAVPFGFIGQKAKKYIPGWWKIFTSMCLWLMNLILDIFTLSIHLTREGSYQSWSWLKLKCFSCYEITVTILKRFRFLTWIWEKIKRIKKKKDDDEEEHVHSFKHSGLRHNIAMPSTGEEAMKRLLACKGKDPYSILGVTPTCTDDDIKKYYKRQAFLVHPDKNQQPGAEEAFKILVHAFDMIGEPERRAVYDRGVAESVQVEQAWSELNDLLAQLQQKVEAATNTIRCSACGSRHKRIKVERPSYAARNCSNCKIHHAAREGDIWAEARCFGFLWHYYACMEGTIYDITEWAGCQKNSLMHLKPDSHQVQYRIALGKQNNQTRKNNSARSERLPPDLENLLNSFYGNQDNSNTTKRRNKKSNK